MHKYIPHFLKKQGKEFLKDDGTTICLNLQKASLRQAETWTDHPQAKVDAPYEEACRRATSWMFDVKYFGQAKRGPRKQKITDEKLGRTH